MAPQKKTPPTRTSKPRSQPPAPPPPDPVAEDAEASPSERSYTLVVPPSSERAWNLPEPWMGLWIETATHTGSLVDACKAASVSLIDVREARQNVPAFNEACRLYDEVIDLMICDAVRGHAVKGDTRAQSLYFNQVRSRIFGEVDAPDVDIILTSEGAETLIREALKGWTDPLDQNPGAPKVSSRKEGSRS